MAAPLILALDVTGFPLGWISWQEALSYLAADRIDRQVGEVQFTFQGGTCRRTGRRSALCTSSIVVLKGRNPLSWQPRSIPLTNRNLFARDRRTCGYCLASGSHVRLTRDHIVPLSRGGSDSWRNCITACFACNNRKGARTIEQAGLRLHFVPYEPSVAEGLILANRHILADQMDMLTSLAPAGSRILAS